jgi:dipeptidyl aminopeptidase/acylaminoacyl peptidase
MPVDGSAPPEPLSAEPEDEFQPSISPDGKWVAFHAVRSGSTRDLYTIPLQGGVRTTIPTPTSNNLAPRFSPDGRSVVYIVWGDKGGASVQAVRRAPGGSGWERTKRQFELPAIQTGGVDWSPDGRWICYVNGSKLLRADTSGGRITTLAELPPTFTPFYGRWGGDGREIYVNGVRTDGTYVIYSVPAGGGAAREVAHSDGPSYQNLRFSFDVIGKTLYVSLADPQSDIWSAEVVRK